MFIITIGVINNVTLPKSMSQLPAVNGPTLAQKIHPLDPPEYPPDPPEPPPRAAGRTWIVTGFEDDIGGLPLSAATNITPIVPTWLALGVQLNR